MNPETSPTITLPTGLPTSLQIEQIFRHGPRYIVAKLTDGHRAYHLKHALPGPTYIHQFDHLTYTNATQLTVERDTLLALNQFLPDLAPQVLQFGPDWYLREHVSGQSLGLDESPFFYNIKTLGQVPPEQFFLAIQTIQSLTYKLPKSHVAINSRRQRQVPRGLIESAIEALLPWARGISRHQLEQSVERATQIMRQAPAILAHDEPYPPHWFLQDNGKLTVIDWENARPAGTYHDHARIWLRAFERPTWQKRYLDLIQARSFNPDLWRATILMDALEVHDYLRHHDTMPGPRRDAAIEYTLQLAQQNL